MPIFERINVDGHLVSRAGALVEKCLVQGCRCHKSFQIFTSLPFMHGCLFSDHFQILQQSKLTGKFHARFGYINCGHLEGSSCKNVPHIGHGKHWGDYWADTSVPLALSQIETDAHLLQGVPTVATGHQSTIWLQRLFVVHKSVFKCINPVHGHI